MQRVLVVYASRHGWTAGIVERIGETLRAEGLDAVVAPARNQPDPAGFDAYVVGSAVYMGQWEADAKAYVRRHGATLAQRPVWLFSSGPVGTARVDKHGNSVLQEPPTMSQMATGLKARGTTVFFGGWDPSLPGATFGERLTLKMPAIRDLLPIGDYREWPVIEAWAREIAKELRTPAPVG